MIEELRAAAGEHVGPAAHSQLSRYPAVLESPARSGTVPNIHREARSPSGPLWTCCSIMSTPNCLRR
ncbi:MAG: hypothetical protein ABIQ18_09300 [Umezawaea sp.]